MNPYRVIPVCALVLAYLVSMPFILMSMGYEVEYALFTSYVSGPITGIGIIGAVLILIFGTGCILKACAYFLGAYGKRLKRWDERNK